MTPDSTRSPARVPVWRGLLQGNVLWLALASFFNDVSSEMIFPLLPLFLVSSLGAGPAFLGVVEGVSETAASMFKLGGGWISDRLRKRKAVVGWGYGIAAVSRPLLAAAAAPWHVLGLRLADRAGKGVRTAPRDALLADSVHVPEQGRAFGLHRAADHAGAILGTLLAAGLLLLWPGRLRLVFLLALIPASLAPLCVILRVREIRQDIAVRARSSRPAAPARAPSSVPAGGAASEPPAPTVGPTIKPLLAYLVVLALFTLGNASDAFLLLRARELGVPLALIPILWGFFHVSKMACNLAGGAAADRTGPRRAILLGWLVYAATYAGFALARSGWQVWALFLVYGLFYGLTEPAERTMVARLAPPAAMARAFGAYHFAIGVAALPASILFGAVWQVIGAPAAFALGATLALFAATLLPLVVPRA